MIFLNYNAMDALRRYRNLFVLSAASIALIFATKFIPWWLAASFTAVLAVAVIERAHRIHSRMMTSINQRLAGLRSEGLVIEERAKGTEDDILYRMIITLLGDLERSQFKLVEKNIQLLSLKEIGRTIISSLDEQKLVDSVFEYLSRGVGYKETAFIVLRRRRGVFQAIVTSERPSRILRRSMTFGFEELSDSSCRSCFAGKSLLIKDASMHPLFTINGEALFPGSTMTSYLCVPLVKSVESTACMENEDCTLRKVETDRADASLPPYLRSSQCLSCPHTPLLGALIVTDGFRGSPLTNIDQVTVETVASLVSSNMENWYLYQELRQEEIFRERIIEGMLNGVFVIDRDGNVTLANRRARDLSGYRQRHVRALKIEELIVGGSGSGNSRSPVLKIFEGAGPIIHKEAFLQRKDGKLIPIRMNIALMTGEDGAIQGAIIEFADLSEIKRMEEEIRHLDRLAVLGRFTSAVAHEVRNPLTGIAAGIQYLARTQELDAEQRKSISLILDEVERLNRIVNDLFKVAKPRNLLYQKVSVSDLIERSKRSIADLITSKNISFESKIGEDVPSIEVDPDQIVQVLINLIKNAGEAVANGGRICVSARIGTDADRVSSLKDNTNVVCIEVVDNGGGIDPEDREKIWEPFFSRKKNGTGLGLFVSQSIIQNHRGWIAVSSEPGSGSAFRVYLPISRPKEGEQVEAGHSTSG